MNDIITNGTEIKQRILSEINNASQSIYLAMAYFTDREIAMAIVGAKNRNVLVDIILSSNIQNDTVKLMLKGANIIVHAFETHERDKNLISQVYAKPIGQRDNEILEAVWRKWAKDSGFKDLIWDKY